MVANTPGNPVMQRDRLQSTLQPLPFPVCGEAACLAAYRPYLSGIARVMTHDMKRNSLLKIAR